MAERRDSDREVLTSLPRTRPVRRSGKRADRPAATNGAPAAKTRATKATATAGKAKPKAKAKTKAKTARDAKPKSARAPKAAATVGAKAAADVKLATPEPKTKAAPKTGERPRSTPRRKVPPAGYAAPTSRSDDSAGAGTADVLGTTIQAAAELAQIGLTVGRQTLRSMLDRLPKP